MVISECDIRVEFTEFGIDVANKEILERILQLCEQHRRNAETFTEEWMAFSTNNQLDSHPTIKHLNKFEIEELKKKKSSKRESAFKGNRIYDATSIDDCLGNIDDLLDSYGTPELREAAKKRQRTPMHGSTKKKFSSESNSYVASPIIDVTSSSPTLSWTPSEKYKSRANVGDVVSEFGNAKAVEWKTKTPWQCNVEAYEDRVIKERYNYMYEKLGATARHLNAAIEEMEDVFKEKFNLEEISHLGMQSAATIEVVGRISCDSNGKLNASSMLLEGSHRTSAGVTVKLDVGRLQSYSFFPGQIVALSGISNAGETFVGQKLFDGVYPSLPNTRISFTNNDPLHIFIAAGPYTTTDSLSYEPLEDFLKVVEEQGPHACFLIGPFVDAKHKDIEAGNFPQTYDNIFTGCLEIIGNFAKRCTSTAFIIVPSSRDIHHDFIYPTPPFSVPTSLAKTTNLRFVSDPSTLNINGLIVGVTATDVLFNLGKEEVSFPPGMPDRMGRLASHLLSQQSYCPLYPPPEDVHINWKHFNDFAKLPVIPHVLILPSDLNCFIKDVKGCCCLNPQRLTRGTGGGTYARVAISAANVPAESSLIPNISAQVVRV